MKRDLATIYAKHTNGAQASEAKLREALAQEVPRRQRILEMYLAGTGPLDIGARLNTTKYAVHGQIVLTMRSMYRRIVGVSLRTLNPNKPSLQRKRTGYRRDADRHVAARKKVPAKRRKAIASMGAKALAKAKGSSR